MLRKKSFKFLSILVAIIVTSSLFLVPASAETKTVSFSEFNDGIYCNIYHFDGSSVTSDITSSFSVSYSGNNLMLRVTNGASIPIGSWILVDCSMLLAEPFNKYGFTYGGFTVNSYGSLFTFSLEKAPVNYCERETSSGEFFDGDISTDGRYLDINFSQNDNQKAFKYINFAFIITTQANYVDGTVIPISFTDLSYFYTNPQDEIIYGITQNQNENTDKIINGWESDSSLDTSVSDDYGAKEQEILDGTAAGRDQSVSLFNNFGSLFTTGYFMNGILAVSAILKEFIAVDWLSGLLQISLSLGIFAFLIGSIQLIGSKTSKNNSTKGGKP